MGDLSFKISLEKKVKLKKGQFPKVSVTPSGAPTISVVPTYPAVLPTPSTAMVYAPGPHNMNNHNKTPRFQPPKAVPGFRWVKTDLQNCNKHVSIGIIAGHEASDRSPIFIGRAWHDGELVPCKIIPNHRAAYISYNMQEIIVHDFEMYCRTKPSIEWVPSSHGGVPPGAVIAGKTKTGENLYIARAHYMGSVTPGKVHPSHRCCYIAYGGAERKIESYEVLVHKHQY